MYKFSIHACMSLGSLPVQIRHESGCVGVGIAMNIVGVTRCCTDEQLSNVGCLGSRRTCFISWQDTHLGSGMYTLCVRTSVVVNVY